MQLLPDECRVLGVLVEKELTTPEQYPLSLNAVTNACNQKNNRDPVTSLTEDQAMAALTGLQDKHLAVFVNALGSRVLKYRHNARETMQIGITELVILAELLLRGPQTLGEIRTRASRMHPLESLDVVKNTLQYMMDRPEPLVRELPPSPGSRAERYAQLLCPDLHPLTASAESGPTATLAPANPASPSLAARVEKLEQELSQLRQAMEKLAKSLGESDILPPTA